MSFRQSAIFSLVLIAVLMVSERALADSTDKQQADVIVSFSRFGVSFYKGLAAEYDAGKAARMADARIATEDVKLVSEHYKAVRHAAEAKGKFAKDAGKFFISLGSLAASATGVGTVPAVLLTAAANSANDKIAASIQKSGTDRAEALLLRSADKWSGSLPEIQLALQEGRHDDAAKLFDSKTGLLSELGRELSNDEFGREVAQRYLLDALRETNAETIKAVGKTDADVKSLRSEFSSYVKSATEYAKETRKALTAVEKNLADIDKEVANASVALAKLSDDQAMTAARLSAVQKILFDRGSPVEKLALLDVGGLGLGPTETANLRSFYQAESKKQELLKNTGRAISAAADVALILRNTTGFNNEDLNTAIQYGSVAQTVASQALTGNYLGALVSLSGALGGATPDPEAQRFSAIMDALGEIKQQLNKVIELQIKTLEAIEGLSQQLTKFDAKITAKLDGLKFELDRVSYVVRSSLWSQVSDCQSAWRARDEDGKIKRFNEREMRFTGTQELVDFASVHYVYVTGCGTALQRWFDAVPSQRAFGNLLSLSGAINPGSLVGTPTEEKALTEERSRLERYRDDLFVPTAEFVVQEWSSRSRSKLSLANALATLAEPATSVNSIRAREKDLQLEMSNCGSNSILADRIRWFICKSGSDATADEEAQVASHALLREPMVVEQLNDIGRWVSLTSPAWDLLHAAGGPKILINELPPSDASLRGRQLVSDFMSIVDIAIAQNAMLFGDITASYAYDLAWDKESHQPNFKLDDSLSRKATAIRLLKNDSNPWLRRNVLMLALHDAADSQSEDNLAGDWVAYDACLSHLESFDWTMEPAAKDALAFGESCLKKVFAFGEQTKLTRLAAGQYALSWPGVDPNFLIPLPDADAYHQRSLVYPRHVHELIQLKQTFVERLVDYDFLDGLADKKLRETYALVLWNGARAEASR